MRKAKVVWHRDDDAVSPVIGTILMVAITVVLAAVLWLMVSGMITDTDEQKTTVNIASPNMSTYTTQIDPDGVAASGDEYYVYDAVLNVNKITPKDDKVLWSDVRILIKGSDGSVLMPEDILGDDGTATYDRDGTVATGGGVIDVEFWYVETQTGDTKMSAGDAVKITGMTDGSLAALDDYQGATVIMKKAGEQIGSITLPTDFS
jgi:flagellin-like protein